MSDEAQIRELLERYGAAIEAKDAKAMIACYSDDVVAYDLAPPLAMYGHEVCDPKGIQEWFDTWSTPIRSKSRDLRILRGGTIGQAYCLLNMTGKKKGGKVIDLWFRSTALFRKDGSEWKISHIHNSVPFAMDGSDRALLDLKP
jgi:PhnB protein